jgi:hypothetical protein
MGDACLATPAISNGMVIVRTLHDLYGVGRQDMTTSQSTNTPEK